MTRIKVLGKITVTAGSQGKCGKAESQDRRQTEQQKRSRCFHAYFINVYSAKVYINLQLDNSKNTENTLYRQDL